MLNGSPPNEEARVVLNPASNDLDLVVRAAWLYYEDGLTQAQIATRLFVSRQTVGRLLESARQHGIVRIELDAQYLAAMDLATQVREKFGLRDAVVVPTAQGRLSRVGNDYRANSGLKRSRSRIRRAAPMSETTTAPTAD